MAPPSIQHGIPASIVGSSSVGNAPAVEQFLYRVFSPPASYQCDSVENVSKKRLTLETLEGYIDKSMKTNVSQLENEHTSEEDNEGRICGNSDQSVLLDRKLTHGNFFFEHDQLGVTSLSNFSTITANACVFKGKWVYEVMLGSKGLMQIGWSTTKCVFSPQEGVGDTPNSYAYDGNRTRKWNMNTQKYGESWSSGDVISCTIDCDEGLIGFYRNGKNLGVAYDNITLGPGFAYLPAISLSVHESVRLNFGSSPLKYPIEGFRPMQARMAPPSIQHGIPASIVGSSSVGNAPAVEQFLYRVFSPPASYQCDSVENVSKKRLTLETLEGYIDKSMKTNVSQLENEHTSEEDNEGRICGNSDQSVLLDRKLTHGNFFFEHDQLGVTSLSNFSTITANACVFKGKWVYEVMLGSKGLMQIGWSTTKCVFSPQEGVGDTPNSYAYDGNRTRKWNMNTQKYGESWSSGDVISCTIDCDEGLIGFYRNGKNLGVAYDNITLGPGFAYLPAISLSVHESVRLNFGSSPLKYPIEGFRPMQDPPTLQLQQASQLVKYLERLLTANTCTTPQPQNSGDFDPSKMGVSPSVRIIVASQILDKLAPFFYSVYLTEAVLLKLLLKFCNTSRHTGAQPFVDKILQLMWTCLEEDDMRACMRNLFSVVLTSYRFSQITVDLKNQHTYLVLLLSLLRHVPTRHLALDCVLWDIVQFPLFMHIKPPDDPVLEQLIPDVWWDKNDKACKEQRYSQDFASVGPEFAPSDDSMSGDGEDKRDKQTYLKHCAALKVKVGEIEEIQIEILKLLMDNTDSIGSRSGKSSRAVFVQKLRDFLYSCQKGQKFAPSPCPLPVSLCFMHRLVKALRYYWDLNAKNNSAYIRSNDAYVPIWVFTAKKNGKDSPSDSSESSKSPGQQNITERLGGVYAHVKKTVQVDESLLLSESQPSEQYLLEILDCAIMLYQLASHKQLLKMSELRENFREMSCALNETCYKLTLCESEKSEPEVKEELLNSKQVLKKKVVENSRQLSWLIAVVFSKEKQEDVHWLLRCSLATMRKAIAHGNAYSFIPEYYIDVVLDAYKALTRFFAFVTPFEGSQGYISTLNEMAFFLAHNFSEAGGSFIVNSDVRDNIIQSLACFVCYPESLKSLEQMSLQMRKSMIRTLLSPYESRSWPQINWILVRLWKGCGFGYRYAFPPHMSPVRLRHYTQDYDSASFQRPCPSPVFQQHVAEQLTQDDESMQQFINSVLNQLNWAFSEFLTQLSEIQGSPLTSSSDSSNGMNENRRKHKLVATCFDLSVGLLRVIELIVAVAPQLFTDPNRPNSELLLKRLMQLLSQVFSRVTSQTGAFQQVIRRKKFGSLDSVDNYPILTATAGILTRLAFQSPAKGREVAVNALFNEASFTLESLEFMVPSVGTVESLIGTSSSNSVSQQHQKFSFCNYEEISTDEIEQVQKLIQIFRTEKESSGSSTSILGRKTISDEDLCPICCASEISVMFEPCGHTSCKSCIQHQLMNRNECFFCKRAVEKFSKIQPQSGAKSNASKIA